MNKYEMAHQVANETGKTLAEVTPIINSLFNVMANTILSGEKISVPRLGSFSLRPRKQRQGYDAFHGRVIQIPESMSLKFDVSPSFQKKIKEKYDKGIVQKKERSEVLP